jgi:hypothetical protein
MRKTQPALPTSLQHTNTAAYTRLTTSGWIDTEQVGNSYNNQQVRKQNNILDTTHLHTIYKPNI